MLAGDESYYQNEVVRFFLVWYYVDMTYTQVVKKEIKALVKEGVKEALGVEFMKLRAALMPLISEKEQKDIELRYKKPSRKATRTYTIEN